MTGVVVDGRARESGKDACFRVPRSAECDVGEFSEAFRMEILQLAVGGVVGRQLCLSPEAL